ncbi:MAG: hypothetical protein MRJ93_13130 [Nitrososphaeraceae archaeon]|nr:hypothetical protein [Nitrososphaeraceae archaeon]
MSFEKLTLFLILFVTPALLAALAVVPNENGIQDIVAQTSNENETNQTSTSKDKEPAIGETFVWQGTVSSMQDPLQGHESHQVTVLLPPREDKAVYAGLLTFVASKPVEVVTLHYYDTEGRDIPQVVLDEYGLVMNAPAPWSEGDSVATAMMALPYEDDTPTFSNNIPFVGNVLGLHTTDGEPFMATYTVKATIFEPESKNNLDSLNTAIGVSENTNSTD